MKVILEGCDGTGKSTIAKLWAERYKLDICHCTQYDPKDLGFYYHTMCKDDVIWDRHFISESIYAKIFGRREMLDRAAIDSLVDQMKKENVQTYIVTADPKIIASRISSRGEEDKRVVDNIEYINQKYIEFAMKYGIDVIDTTKITFDQLMNFIGGIKNA